MKQRVATITLNPAYDLFGFCPEIMLGDVNRIQTTGLNAAGKGINVARVLRELGMPVTVSGFLGRENQNEFSQFFEQIGLNDQFYSVDGRTRINVKLTDAQQLVTDFNFSGFTVTPQAWEIFATQSLQWFAGFDMIAVSGSLPGGISPTALTDWLIALKAQCPRVVFDSSEAALSAGLKARPWLIKPNEKELAEWAKRPLKTQDDIIGAANQLVESGIENVVVSMGKAGALWVTPHEIWQATPPVCEVVSTVGAGDSMVAGLMYGILTEQTVPETLRLASAISALSVKQLSVGLPDKDQLSIMLPQIRVRALHKKESTQ